MELSCASVTSKHMFVWFMTFIGGAYLLGSVTGCGAAYEHAIDYFCLAKFRLDMQALDQRRWCSWEDTIELYWELTNCTYIVALKMDCFWPNRQVDLFFIQVHQLYFQNCSPTGRLLQDPPNGILGPFILIPVLVTLLMTALVVWRSKRSEGMV
ncbi:receptor activity-modifying protein 1-like [Anguilla anguilla]|uniref:receptor activity-modifying protein 1-like n=1 Tax=Anguilla anguilla TaxID=7936 RepID=UPI0015AEA2CA|nr:receptor activity-modifying protein 1-like [Anguilla anguilla]XP_035250105.1 receptor activity-modifying protein 1-like [Anguilla anguilla]